VPLSRPAWLAAVLLAGLLGGCLDAGEPAPTPAPASLPARLAQDLPPPPAWDAQAGLGWWESFVKAYTARNTFAPRSAAAAQHIASSLEGFGLEVTVLEYPACAPLVGSPCAPTAAGPATVHVVMGLKRGASNQTHAIALGAHYDNQATVEGAYDNGSGTAMVVNVCGQLAQVELEHSLLCLLFDGEELGVLGSSRFVADPPAGAPSGGSLTYADEPRTPSSSPSKSRHSSDLPRSNWARCLHVSTTMAVPEPLSYAPSTVAWLS